MAIEDDVEALKQAVEALAASNQANMQAVDAAATAIANISAAVQALVGTDSLGPANQHLFAILLIMLNDRGVITSNDFAEAVAESLAVVPDGPIKTRLEGFQKAAQAFNPNETIPTLTVIEGGKSDEPDGAE